MRKTKIVVPIMLTELAELEKVSVSDYRTADIVEWRADFLSADEILEMAPKSVSYTHLDVYKRQP